MSRALVEHGGEVELALESTTTEGLFREAAAAFRELVGAADGDGRPVRRLVRLPASETALLLVDWLNELVFLAEVEGFVPELVESIDLRGGLRATVAGHRGRPRHLVKAATLGGLRLTETEGASRARVVLDV